MMFKRYRHVGHWFAPLVGLGAMLSLHSGCNQSAPATPAPDLTRAVAIRAAMGGGAASESSDGGLASGPQPTGWATLKGTFKVTGEVPPRFKLKVDKDTEVCAPAGLEVLGEDLIVASDGGLKNVVVYLTSSLPAEEPWTHSSQAPGKTDQVEFDQQQCVFTSHVLAFQATQPLLLKNSDPVGHNAKLDAKVNNTFNQIIPADASAVYQPTAEEAAPFPVACSIHPWMSAWLLIRSNGYFAVTDENGSFEIANLPAGIELEFRAWQEKASFLANVTLNGNQAEWKKGRFTVKLEPGAETAMDVAITAEEFK